MILYGIPFLNNIGIQNLNDSYIPQNCMHCPHTRIQNATVLSPQLKSIGKNIFCCEINNF